MNSLRHCFVDRMPVSLEDGVLYVSLEYGTVLHKCACGCGLEVNTPLGRTDWALTYDGETISLWPSVGNWSFPCRSHYVIKRNEIKWAGDWSDEQVEKGRRADRALKASQYSGAPQAAPSSSNEISIKPLLHKPRSFWERLTGWLR